MDELNGEQHWSGKKMCMKNAYAFTNKELHEFSGDTGNGYFDSFSFKGVSLSRIHGCVNSSLEICKTRGKTFLGIHICLKGNVEYSVDQMIDPYHVNALEIATISGELSGIKSKLTANIETSEISILLDEDAYKELVQSSDLSVSRSAALNRNFNFYDMGLTYKTLLHLASFPHPKNQLECISLQGYCYAAIGEVLSQISQSNTASIPTKAGSAERVKTLIDSNVKNNQTIRQLATISGTNECYLKKEFKALTGCSIADYRQKQRMRYAKDLLWRGHLNIGALATEVGYQNSNHFIRIFRRHTGVHPKEYRLNQGSDRHDY